MSDTNFNKTYWSERWKTGETQWDVGQPTTPLKNYIDGLNNKTLKILVPGAGNGYEGIYLIEKGFTHTTIMDICEEPLEALRKNHGIKDSNLVLADFFEHNGQYDLILEQTFFCALDPKLRSQYVDKCYELLVPGGKIAGVMFNCDFGNNHPPFGGSAEEYVKLFEKKFEINIAPCYNSIPPRQNRELFVQFVKK